MAIFLPGGLQIHSESADYDKYDKVENKGHSLSYKSCSLNKLTSNPLRAFWAINEKY